MSTQGIFLLVLMVIVVVYVVGSMIKRGRADMKAKEERESSEK